MTNESLLNELRVCADELDKQGFYAFADRVTDTMQKIAQAAPIDDSGETEGIAYFLDLGLDEEK